MNTPERRHRPMHRSRLIGYLTERTRTFEYELWKDAKVNDLLPTIISDGLMSQEELEKIGHYYGGESNRKPEEPLLTKFSLAVANCVKKP